MTTILTANATGSIKHYGPCALAEGDGVNMEGEQLFIADSGGLLSVVLTLNPFGDFFTHTKQCIPWKGLVNQSLAQPLVMPAARWIALVRASQRQCTLQPSCTQHKEIVEAIH